MRRSRDQEGMRSYARHCPIPGTKPSEYAPRLLSLGSECQVIAGIHFRGGELTFPFVDVSAETEPLPLDAAVELLSKEFRNFEPRALRVWRSAEESAPEGGEDDFVIRTAPLRELLSAPRLAGSERIRLEPDPELTSYEEYRALYEISAPKSSRVSPETRSSLRRCVEQGAFFHVSVDATPAGFMAARPEAYRWWKGWVIVEEILHPDFRGQGLGAAMQQKFLDELDPERGEAVFGTIAADNLPSLKTSERVGRRSVEVGSFVFLRA